MDLEPEYPEKDPRNPKKSGGGPSLPNDQELIAGGLAGELVSSHGSASILRHIRVLHNLSEEKRKQLDGRPSPDQERPSIVKFLTSDHPSHLSKAEALRAQLEKSKRAVQILDDTDFTGKNLYEFIPPELKQEIEDQLAGMEDMETIQKTLEAEVSSNCGDVWDEYKKIKKQSEDPRSKTVELLLLGPETNTPEDKADRTSLKSAKKEIGQIQSVGELLQLEKARLVTLALTASVKDYPMRKLEAEKILGTEFTMIEAQVQHMEDLMMNDLAKADTDVGPMNHAEGLDLVSEEIKARMVDAQGEENPSLNSEQKTVLEAAYTNALYSFTKPESKEDRVNRKISFVLAASETIALGKEAMFANTLKMIREMPAPEKEKEKEKETTPFSKGSDKIKETDKIKKGLGKVIGTWPKVLVVGGAGLAFKSLQGQMHHRSLGWQFLQNRHKAQNGSQEELLKVFAEAHEQLNNIS